MVLNYKRQLWSNKEWIVVVNKDRVNLAPYRKMAAQLANVKVFHLPASMYTLGQCLNFAAARAKYPYITKMDDDEYYAPHYLRGLMRSFRLSKADVVGKRAYFIYLRGSRLLLQRFRAQNRFVGILAGGTLTFKRHVWRKVKFPSISLGEDVGFCRACRRRGFRLYAGDRYNFCTLRRKQPNSHTWKVSDLEFINHPQTKIIAYGSNFKPYVDRPFR